VKALLEWALAFGFTQVVEVPIYLRVTRSFSTSLLASALTHPIVWFVFPLLPLGYWPMVACAEAFAVLVEAAWLHKRGARRPLLLSLLGNGASFSLGLLSRELFGVP
jgi:hypothetical protein